jgi:acetylglutamate kinase
MKIVIKFAGALLEDAATVKSLAVQVAQLAKQGHEILVVHGGGKIFTATLKRLGIESKFVSGLRVTDREARDVAVMVFAGLLNKQLAAAISRRATGTQRRARQPRLRRLFDRSEYRVARVFLERRAASRGGVPRTWPRRRTLQH